MPFEQLQQAKLLDGVVVLLEQVLHDDMVAR
jgi:hypothetical protein